ncbi:hypothetical protein NQZ68_032159 [Dissostichus eleginoides]|nr:hypothetical protein NQZ68_032159 [Dissostichus eleginoides]
MRGLGSICAKPCWCQWTLWFPGQTLRHADIRPSQTLPDKDDGWGRTLAPAKPGSFLGAERY